MYNKESDLASSRQSREVHYDTYFYFFFSETTTCNASKDAYVRLCDNVSNVKDATREIQCTVAFFTSR